MLAKLRERGDLALKHLKDETGVKLRIVDMSSLQPAVLIVLDQVVIGVLWEGEWVEPQRIDRRLANDHEFGRSLRQVVQVEVNDVVPEQEVRRAGELVKPR